DLRWMPLCGPPPSKDPIRGIGWSYGRLFVIAGDALWWRTCEIDADHAPYRPGKLLFYSNAEAGVGDITPTGDFRPLVPPTVRRWLDPCRGWRPRVGRARRSG